MAGYKIVYDHITKSCDLYEYFAANKTPTRNSVWNKFEIFNRQAHDDRTSRVTKQTVSLKYGIPCQN